jgi:excisionase family DNA binding protein
MPEPPGGRDGVASTPKYFRRFYLSRGERIRTSDILLPKSADGVAGVRRDSQPLGTVTDSSRLRFQPSQAFASLDANFASPVLPQPPPEEDGLRGRRRRLRVLTGGREALLSVREVASYLGVCTATVYKLCACGALRHVRVLNAVRVAPRDLSAFIAQRHEEVDGPEAT